MAIALFPPTLIPRNSATYVMRATVLKSADVRATGLQLVVFRSLEIGFAASAVENFQHSAGAIHQNVVFDPSTKG
jgi:hypothetical protein